MALWKRKQLAALDLKVSHFFLHSSKRVPSATENFFLQQSATRGSFVLVFPTNLCIQSPWLKTSAHSQFCLPANFQSDTNAVIQIMSHMRAESVHTGRNPCPECKCAYGIGLMQKKKRKEKKRKKEKQKKKRRTTLPADRRVPSLCWAQQSNDAFSCVILFIYSFVHPFKELCLLWYALQLDHFQMFTSGFLKQFSTALLHGTGPYTITTLKTNERSISYTQKDARLRGNKYQGLHFDDVKVVDKVAWNSTDGDPYGVVMDSSEMASLQDVFNDLLKKKSPRKWSNLTKAAKLLSIPLVFLERPQLRLRFDRTIRFNKNGCTLWAPCWFFFF